jgi:hypothetical protein
MTTPSCSPGIYTVNKIICAAVGIVNALYCRAQQQRLTDSAVAETAAKTVFFTYISSLDLLSVITVTSFYKPYFSIRNPATDCGVMTS